MRLFMSAYVISSQKAQPIPPTYPFIGQEDIAQRDSPSNWISIT